MSDFRANFTAMLQSTVNTAVLNNDEKRGRQLATMFEKASVVLRKRFGGRSIWQFEKRERPSKPVPDVLAE